MWRFYLDIVIDTLLTLALIAIWTLVIAISATNTVIYVFIMTIIGGALIGAMMFEKTFKGYRYKELIKSYFRNMVNKYKEKKINDK